MVEQSKEIKLNRREKAKKKKLRRRKIFLLTLAITIALISLYFFNVYRIKQKLNFSDTALKYYMVDSNDSKLTRIDNSELIFSHEDKSIYNVFGINEDEEFKMFEVCLKKNNSKWNIDYLKDIK